MIVRSDNASVSLKSGSPACLVPRKSPGPRIFKSSSAILKPSIVSSSTFSLLYVSSEFVHAARSRQMDFLSPLPTLPLN